MADQIEVSQFLDIPETGGKADEIGGHVEISEETDRERVTCPQCKSEIGKRSTGHVCDGEFRTHPTGEPGVDGGRSA